MLHQTMKQHSTMLGQRVAMKALLSPQFVLLFVMIVIVCPFLERQ